MTTLPLVHEEVKKDLLSRIGRQWPAGTRLPPVSELARELGTGQRNTQRAMQELAREGYIQARPKRGTFVSRDLPRRPRRAVTSTHQATIGVLLHGVGDRFSFEMAEALVAELKIHHVPAEQTILPRMRELEQGRYAHFAALALVRPEGTVTLAPRQLAVIVSQTNNVSVNALGGYDIVSVEQEQGSFMAGRWLRDAGCQSACFVGVRHADSLTVTEPTSAVRLRGFELGWGESIPEHLQLWGRNYGEVSGAYAASRFHALPSRPQAVFTASDDLAIGFALGGKALGLEPGRDYQLIGFDGQYRARTLAECPPITSVALPAADMGRRAAQLLVQRLAHPAKPVERVLLGCSIFPGETVVSRSSPSSPEISS